MICVARIARLLRKKERNAQVQEEHIVAHIEALNKILNEMQELKKLFPKRFGVVARKISKTSNSSSVGLNKKRVEAAQDLNPPAILSGAISISLSGAPAAAATSAIRLLMYAPGIISSPRLSL